MPSRHSTDSDEEGALPRSASRDRRGDGGGSSRRSGGRAPSRSPRRRRSWSRSRSPRRRPRSRSRSRSRERRRRSWDRSPPPPPPPRGSGWGDAPPPPPPPGGAGYPHAQPPYDAGYGHGYGGGGGGGGWGAPPRAPPPPAAPPSVPREEFAAAQKAGLSRLVAEAGRDGAVWWYLDAASTPHGPFSLARLRAWARALRGHPATRHREAREFAALTVWRDGAPFRVHVGTLLAVHRTRSPSPEAEGVEG